MQLTRWAKRNPMEAVMVAVGIGVALLNSGEIQNSLSREAATRAIVASNQQQVRAQEMLQEKQKELEPIANARYEAGCEMVISFEVGGQYKVLSVGSPVIDGNVASKIKNLPTDKLPLWAVLPEGSTVCDAYGNTAILEANGQGFPVVKTIAATTNLDLVRKAMERVKARRAGALK